MTKEAFSVHITFQEKDLRKFKCHSGMDPTLPYADDVEAILAFPPDIAAATARIRRGWDERERRVRRACCLPWEARSDPGAMTVPIVSLSALTAGAVGDDDLDE